MQSFTKNGHTIAYNMRLCASNSGGAKVGQLAGCTHEGRAAARIQRREAVTDDAGPWASALGTALHWASALGTAQVNTGHCATLGTALHTAQVNTGQVHWALLCTTHVNSELAQCCTLQVKTGQMHFTGQMHWVLH